MWKEKKECNKKKRRRINLYTGKVSWVISIRMNVEDGQTFSWWWGVGRGGVVLADQRDEQLYQEQSTFIRTQRQICERVIVIQNLTYDKPPNHWCSVSGGLERNLIKSTLPIPSNDI